MSVDECVRLEELGLSDYVKYSRMTAGDDSLKMFVKDKSRYAMKAEYHDKRSEKWKEKPLHGQYMRKNKDMKDESWRWLRSGILKKKELNKMQGAA